jgi:hypothetical protein
MLSRLLEGTQEMAQRPKSTFQKLEKEKARQQRRKEKDARRLDAKQLKANRDVAVNGEDPDLAGIKPGPQPLPEQWQYLKRDAKV